MSKSETLDDELEGLGCNYLLAGGSTDSGSITKYDLNSPKSYEQIYLDQRITCINFILCLDEDTILLSCEGSDDLPEDILCTYSLKNKKLEEHIFCLKGGTGSHIWHVTSSKSRDLFACSSWNNKVYLLNQKGKKKLEYSHSGFVNRTVINDPMNLMYSCSNDRTIRTFSFQKNEVIDVHKEKSQVKSINLLDNDLLYCSESSVGIMDVRTMSKIIPPLNYSTSTESQSCHSSRFVPSNPYLFVTAGSYSTFMVDRRKPSSFLFERKGEYSRVNYRLSFVGEKYYAVNGEDGTTRVFAIKDLKKVRHYEKEEYRGGNRYALSYLYDDLGYIANSLKIQANEDLKERIEFLREEEDEEILTLLKNRIDVKIFGVTFSTCVVFFFL